MDVLKFRLSGDTAFFKKPDVNSNVYFTYGSIHKVALLGIFGAVLGYKGYNNTDRAAKYPEFYEKLQNLKVGIVPNNKKNSINKKVQVFNNSVGYASQEQGGNLIIKEQWLENPSWDIYLLLDNEEALKISDSIINRVAKFIPYLGKNDHLANIDEISIIEGIELTEDFETLDSLFIKGNTGLDVDDEIEEELYKYQERLPIELNELTNLYEFEIFIHTNMFIENTEELIVFEIENKNIVFF